jgi:pimeloyl-ACP methyl ester carboxylesterase
MPNVITVRGDRRGEPLGGGLKVRPGPGAGYGDPIVILIHGYQNSADKAERSYRDFKSAMKFAVKPGALGRFGTVWEFHWPGDHPLGAVSVGSYPVRVGTAIVAGDRLANLFLAKRRGKTVRIIGHSLGCRVALQAVKRVLEMGDDYRGAEIEAVFLLAPAVPVTRCETTGDWYPQPFAGAREHVYYSRRDRALGSVFRAGQFVFGETGTAVGREGRPVPRWDTRTDTDLDHGDYWSSPSVAESVAWELQLRNLRPLGFRSLSDDAGARGRRLERRWLRKRPLPVRALA